MAIHDDRHPMMGAVETPPGTANADTISLADHVVQSLTDSKAEDIVTVSLEGLSSIADVMVIASGRSNRHVKAISETLADSLKHERGLAARLEGKEHGDWVLLDAGDVIVHVFRPEVRAFYQLEKLWMSADRTARSS